ncbi:hypothetical protein B0T24DRAFT_686934 [Lasiosphaeria ovina]|uniref:Uncharacterized protein n=1 Tax=Lasiosphaeria ovina TaxID=92902 RepID=A0AAE0NJW5_9PEZI|nr:hypothetical protein B0T24DRAFT_686934 [Lasiosphaeria ovina]
MWRQNTTTRRSAQAAAVAEIEAQGPLFAAIIEYVRWELQRDREGHSLRYLYRLGAKGTALREAIVETFEWAGVRVGLDDEPEIVGTRCNCSSSSGGMAQLCAAAEAVIEYEIALPRSETLGGEPYLDIPGCLPSEALARLRLRARIVTAQDPADCDVRYYYRAHAKRTELAELDNVVAVFRCLERLAAVVEKGGAAERLVRRLVPAAVVEDIVATPVFGVKEVVEQLKSDWEWGMEFDEEE